MDIGHWEFFEEFNTNDWFGFVYRIIELSTGREYIGKKQFHQHLRKAVKGRKNKIRITKDSDWKVYTSSSTELNEAIQRNGKQNYKFIIESLHKTKGSLVFNEVKAQITEDVLRIKLDDGVTPKYFNKQIAGIKFIPPDECAEETAKKISITLIEKYKIDPHWRSTLNEAQKNALNDKYYTGDHHYLYRIMNQDERKKFIDDHYVSENNTMFGEPSSNKGKTYEEMYGTEKAEEIKEILREKCPKTGVDNGMYGKNHTEEQKEKWKHDPRRKKVGEQNGMFGKPCYYMMSEEKKEEWKNNISKSTKGKNKTAEHAAKIGQAHQGKKKATSTCPHCNFTGRGGNMKRYHFDNCKHKHE